MGKFVIRNGYSKACKKAKSVGHFKTSFGGKHVRVTVGTKGIHPSIRFGKVTYKPLSGNYSVRSKYGTYYGNTKRKSRGRSCGLLTLGLSFEDWLKAMAMAAIGFVFIVGCCMFSTEYKYNDEFNYTIDHYINSIIHGKEKTEHVEQLVYERKAELGFYDPIPGGIKAIATHDIDCSAVEGRKCLEAGKQYYIYDVVGDMSHPDELSYKIISCNNHDYFPESYFEICK